MIDPKYLFCSFIKKAAFTLACFTWLHNQAIANEPDSVYLFSYTTVKDKGRSGLHFAWSQDRKSWKLIGNEYSYVKSDYSRWGSEKQMNDPYLLQGSDGQWQCLWGLNETVNQFAHAASADLISWGRQSYPYLNEGTTVRQPVVHFDSSSKQYRIVYESKGKYFEVTTKDFKAYTPAAEVPATQYKDNRLTVSLPAGTATGTLHRVAWQVVDNLLNAYNLKQYGNNRSRASVKEDSLLFAGLKPVKATVTLSPQDSKPISDLLIGVFFEDINYAADGGIYAELIQNRDFEYRPGDKEGRDKAWNSTYAWSLRGSGTGFTIDSVAPIHANNSYYAVLDVQQPGAALINHGYDGISLKKGETYNFSAFLKKGGKDGKCIIKLVNKEGHTIAQAAVTATSTDWKKYTATLTASLDATNAVLELEPLSAGRLLIDFVSLFPQKTYNNRKNGLRTDLAQTIAAIHPRFIRFPGGCVSHGDGLGNIYRWKNTIGALEARKPQRNLWGYHQTAGLGFYEYFQYCEDIGAEPLPVVAAGVPCQNSANGGQQGGIPMNEMDEYVQDVLDLVEWANGPATSRWGRLRAEAGHPKPFHLKYIGIGNEDQITDVFEERFTMIYNAVQQKHPEVKVIGTAGPFYEGTDYVQGWQVANKLKVPLIDEHYYESPGWFINNQHFYDNYDRNKSRVYLGEYASRGSTLYNALAEALYLTNIERNGDVVSMTSYAPLLAKENHTQWNPDLIYFNNTEVKPTVNYEVQRLYGQNTGNTYWPASVVLSNNEEAIQKRVSFSIVQDSATKDLIIKMVNMLPVETIAKLDLKGRAVSGEKADRWVLQGNPVERNAKAVQSVCAAGNIFDTALPPYSFTVIRIKALH